MDVRKKYQCGHGGGNPKCLMHGPRVHGLLQAAMILSLGEGPKHGYDLLRVLESRLPDEMLPDRGVVYRMLRELEQGGYTTSHLEPGQGGPARKVYTITQTGVSLLKEWSEIIRRRAETLQGFLKDYERSGLRVPEV